MASRSRTTAPSDEGPPTQFADVPPPRPQMIDHSFTLQAIMEVQKSVSQMATKTDRLISDVESHGTKIDDVRGKIRFVQGGLWVIGAIVTIGVAVVGLALRFVPAASR